MLSYVHTPFRKYTDLIGTLCVNVFLKFGIDHGFLCIDQYLFGIILHQKQFYLQVCLVILWV